MTIVGTRPEIIKLSRIIPALDQYFDKHILVHTGQNYDYELNEVFFNDLKIRKPDYFLQAAGLTAVQTIAHVIEKSDDVFEKENPDAVLLYGDTNSCLSVITAKKRKIPIFHMEAGNRCFDARVPEEINRKIVDHLSDINMPLSEHARKYLIAEGLPPEQIIKTGSTLPEVFQYFKADIEKSNILNLLKTQKDDYVLVSLHREENIDFEVNFNLLMESLNLMAQELNKKVFVSTHPRTQKKLNSLKEQQKNFQFDERIEFLKPFGFLDYNKLQQNAFCVVSDSGTITEESSLLGFHAVTVRNAHERPEGMDQGVLIMSGTEPRDILNSVQMTVRMNKPQKIIDYSNINVSEQVVKIIQSYTHYVNRYVWRKMI